jgi:hypothetical protein
MFISSILIIQKKNLKSIKILNDRGVQNHKSINEEPELIPVLDSFTKHERGGGNGVK